MPETSRAAILAAIARNKPELVPLPEIPAFDLGYGNAIEQFSQVLQGIGGQAIEVRDLSDVKAHLLQTFGENRQTVNQVAGLAVNGEDTSAITHLAALESIFLAILPGTLGIAENGAVWVSEKSMGQRVVPFICQHLVLVLEKQKMVSNLHEAYRVLAKAEETDYGVFIAGPSKTADIEQSLVIGAHGARSLRVYLVGQVES